MCITVLISDIVKPVVNAQALMNSDTQTQRADSLLFQICHIAQIERIRVYVDVHLGLSQVAREESSSDRRNDYD